MRATIKHLTDLAQKNFAPVKDMLLTFFLIIFKDFSMKNNTLVTIFHWNITQTMLQINIGTHSVRELFCSCQEEVQKWLLNERACTKVHYWDVVYLSSVEHSKSIGF